MLSTEGRGRHTRSTKSRPEAITYLTYCALPLLLIIYKNLTLNLSYILNLDYLVYLDYVLNTFVLIFGPVTHCLSIQER
jgi:hypothetical protein